MYFQWHADNADAAGLHGSIGHTERISAGQIQGPYRFIVK
jgi:hypothetical protein